MLTRVVFPVGISSNDRWPVAFRERTRSGTAPFKLLRQCKVPDVEVSATTIRNNDFTGG